MASNYVYNNVYTYGTQAASWKKIQSKFQYQTNNLQVNKYELLIGIK